jgi:hypothetical protein
MSKVYRFLRADASELAVCILLANMRQALFAVDKRRPDRHGGPCGKRGEQKHHDRQREIEVHAKNPKNE